MKRTSGAIYYDETLRYFVIRIRTGLSE